MRNQLIWQNTAAPGTANKFAGWDNSGDPVELDITFTDAGIEYASDLSVNFTNRSLPDVGYTSSHIGLQSVDALVINPTAGQDGYVIAWNDGNQEYELVAGGGGITNTAANTELGMSDGTNIVPSGIFMPSVGQTINFGSASIGGSTRTLTATGSATSLTLLMQAKGSDGLVQLKPDPSGADLFNVTGNGIGYVSDDNSSISGLFTLQNTDKDVVLTVAANVNQISLAAGNFFGGTGKQFRVAGTNASSGVASAPIIISGGDSDEIAEQGGDTTIKGGDHGTGGTGGDLILIAGLGGGGGTPGNIRMPNLPTSSAGLSAGDVWSNGGVLTVV